MKYFKRYSLLLLAALLSLSVFSLPADAIKAPNGGNLLFNMAVLTWTSYDETRPGTEVGYHSNVNPDELTKDQYYSVGSFEYYPGEYYGALCRFDVTSSTGTVLFESGTTYDYTFNGIVYSNNASTFNVNRIEFYYRYSDGTNSGYFLDDNANVVFDGYFASSGRRSFTVSSTHTPTKDVTRVWCRVFFSLVRNGNVESGYCSGNMGYGNVDITISETSNSGSLLTSIKDKLTNIFSGISDVGTLLSTVRQRIIDGFDNLGSLLGTVRDKLTTLTSTLLSPLETIRDKLTTLTSTLLAPLNTIRDKIGETVTNIINLPGKIWEGLQNALWSVVVPDWYQGTYSAEGDNSEGDNSEGNNLFWPTEQEMKDIMTAFDDMFSDTFGPIWKIPEELMMTYYETLVLEKPTADAYIDVPEINLDVVGERLTFGPYRIPLIPEGLEDINDYTKILSAVIFTFGFVSMVAHKVQSILKR